MQASGPDLSERAARYWDANREKTNDPAFWMAHPLCREAINRRVTGDPNEWPLDWLRRVHVPTPFSRGISWGCGLGHFERAAVRLGIAREIDAFDISPRSLEDAGSAATHDEFSCIHYRLGNFDDPHPTRGRYDIAFFHASLHHVFELERLFRRLAFALKPGGAIYLDEYIGPSRDRWSPERLELARAILDMVPEEARIQPRLEPPIEANDPSEAVRSEEIPGFCRAFFEMSVWRPYGGQIADLVFPCVDAGWLHSPAGHRFVRSMLEIEEHELRSSPAATHHAVGYGKLKSGTPPLRRLARDSLRAFGRRLRRRIGRP